ncbi:MAG: DUF5103 domain-containing protein [Leadbetterella sp.]|nr:DUF5103 domain-containing protein [Leadbetterella sp.]
MKKVIIAVILLLSGEIRAQQPYEELTGSESLKTVTLYAFARGDRPETRYLNPPVADLQNAGQQIVLEFDDLRARFSQYKVRIMHCEADWTRSRLLDMEYLTAINEFFLNDFQVSQNTKIPYYHYRFVVPKPTISGNFVLQLFENDELVVQRKFWIYENLVNIIATAQPARDPEFWKTHQQLDLRLDLGNYRIGIPRRELKVFLRFNQNLWKEVNNTDLVNSGSNAFTLQQFNNDYLFPAGNEFRYLDISSNFSRGQNVKEVIRGKPDEVFTTPQRSRSGTNFVDAYDSDGGFVISNRDGGDADIGSDYMNVFFRLVPGTYPDGTEPVLYGKLTDWHYLPMEFDPESGFLQHTLLLKNGVYDFAFGLRNTATGETDRSYFEGDFQQAGNTYEVFVYHAVPGKRHISLIGYQVRR